MEKYYSFIVILICSIVLMTSVKADIVSFNSGGDNNLIITPSNELEGFFFHNNTGIVLIPPTPNITTPVPTGGNGILPINFSENKENETQPTKEQGIFQKKFPYVPYWIIIVFISSMLIFWFILLERKINKKKKLK